MVQAQGLPSLEHVADRSMLPPSPVAGLPS